MTTFTTKLLAAIEPQSRRITVSDPRNRALRLVVTPSGSRTFQMRKHSGGRVTTVTLGRFNPDIAMSALLPPSIKSPAQAADFVSRHPPLGIGQARALVALIGAHLAAAPSPAQMKREQRSQASLHEVLDQYVAALGLGHTKRTRKHGNSDRSKTLEWSRTARAHIPAAMQAKRPSALTKESLTSWHRKLGVDSSPYVANRSLQFLRAALNHVGVLPNAAAGIELHYEEKRDRFVEIDEMPLIMESLSHESPNGRDFFLLALLTGARRGRIVGMRFDEIAGDRWRIPAAHSKGGAGYDIPLVAEAARILDRRRKANGRTAFVFPQAKDPKKHIAPPKSQWKRILQRAELLALATAIANDRGTDSAKAQAAALATVDAAHPLTTVLADYRQRAGNLDAPSLAGLRIHDLRRTVGSWLAAGNASLHLIGATLGHRSVEATKIYARLKADPVRSALSKVADAMLGSVVALETKRRVA